MIRHSFRMIAACGAVFCVICISGCASNESALQDNIAEVFDVTAIPLRAVLRQTDNVLDNVGGGLTDEDYENFVD